MSQGGSRCGHNPPRAALGVWSPDQCRLCWHSLNSPDYRRSWGGGPLPGNRTACAHRGPQVALEQCPTCRGGRVQVKVFACARHGRCTLDRKVPGAAACPACPDFRPATITRRNLLFFVTPLAGTGVWQEHVAVLKAHASLFSGRRIVAVVTGEGFDTPETVRREFGDGFEFVADRPNNPGLREVAAFDDLFGAVASTDPEEATFFCQGKGIRYPWAAAVRTWVRVMYRSCLDYWPLVEGLLANHAFAGSFKKVGRCFGKGSPSTWHYSGTFFWLRHSAVFGKPWRAIERGMYGMESWPGVLVPPSQGAALFWDNQHGSPLDLYSEPYMLQTAAPAFAAWEEAHAHQRREWPCTPA